MSKKNAASESEENEELMNSVDPLPEGYLSEDGEPEEAGRVPEDTEDIFAEAAEESEESEESEEEYEEDEEDEEDERAREPRWYIIHTYSGYETKVKNSLLSLIENNNLQDQITDVVIPTEKVLEERVTKQNGAEKKVKRFVDRKIIPAYVFVKMVYSNQLWYMITNTSGVTGFVGPQGKAKALNATEVRRMHLETFVPEETSFAIGQRVKINSGALEGMDGVITEIKTGQRKAMVSVELFGRSTNAEVDFESLSAIGEENK